MIRGSPRFGTVRTSNVAEKQVRAADPQPAQGSDTAKAAGLAGAMIANNVIALGSTVVFARLLSDYGSLAALISYFLILSVAGQAMQVATAREGVLGHLGVGDALIATLRRWTQTMVIFTVVLTVVSILAPRPDRRGGRRQARPVGRRDRHPGRLPVARAVDPPRRAAGRRRLQERRPQPDRRAGDPARHRRRARRGRSRRHRRLPRHAAVVHRDVRLLRGPAAPPRRADDRHEGRARQVRAAIELWTHVTRAWAPIARPDRDRRAAEHRHHRRQAPLHRARTSRAPTRRPRSPPRC